MLRFWGKEIEKDPEACVRAIEETIFDLEVMDQCDDIE